MSPDIPAALAAFVVAVAGIALAVTVIVTAVSLALVVLALRANGRYLAGELVRRSMLPRGELAPPVTIIVPAHNEAEVIEASIRSLLQLTYPTFEVVVVDDGSTDGTFEAIAAAFPLRPVPYLPPRTPVPCQPIVGVWVADGVPLRVVRKRNGGKADAHNAGLNTCHTPYVCLVDADSVVSRDALDRCVAVFANDPDVVAVGAGVGVANGCRVIDGHVDATGLPSSALALCQVLEYLRSFLYGRTGWAAAGGTLIVSGAFGVFRRDALEVVGGLRAGALGEDLDLVLRLHLHRADNGLRWKVAFLPETLCFTEVPVDRGSLAAQRIRWQRGLCEALAANRRLFFRRGSGAAGWIAAPYYLVAELLSPVVELAGLLAVAVAAASGVLDPAAAMAFLALGVTSSFVLSASAIALDQHGFGRYRRPRHVAALLAVALAEQFGYRQLTAWWRLRGLARHARRRDATWGSIARHGDWQLASARA